MKNLNEKLKKAFNITKTTKIENFEIADFEFLRNELIDDLAYISACGESNEATIARYFIVNSAIKSGIIPASIQGLYEAIGGGKAGGFTVPAFNIRTLTYDTARTIFSTAKRFDSKAFIFEIARSEMSYTAQTPEEYTSSILAGAIKENWKGPVFLQGDHVQVSQSRYKENPVMEIENIKSLIKSEIAAGFYNIDIDCSTMVNLRAPTLKEQQKKNAELTAEFIRYIRSIQPEGIMVSIGAEIGEVGGKNSTVEEFEAFMQELEIAFKNEKQVKLINKISVQTGTSHGGIPLPDGRIAKVNLDFSVLENIGKIARSKYGLSGTVQHGASTLPEEYFNLFPKHCASEVHLATAFQNIFYEHNLLPSDLRNRMIEYVKKNFAHDKKENETENQFLYRMRKHALGPFKKEIWNLSASIKEEIMNSMKIKFEIIFDRLNLKNTSQVVSKFVNVITPCLSILNKEKQGVNYLKSYAEGE